MSKNISFYRNKRSRYERIVALMLHQMGHTVQGSDVEKYYFTQRGFRAGRDYHFTIQ